MPQEIAKQLLQILLDTKNFVLAQAPDVCQQLIRWEIVSSLIWGSIGIVLLVMGIVCFLMAFSNDDGDAATVGFVLLLVAIVFFVYNGLGVAKAYYAPKIYLIEYLRNSISIGKG